MGICYYFHYNLFKNKQKTAFLIINRNKKTAKKIQSKVKKEIQRNTDKREKSDSLYCILN